jgi:hypothetical protein
LNPPLLAGFFLNTADPSRCPLWANSDVVLDHNLTGAEQKAHRKVEIHCLCRLEIDSQFERIGYSTRTSPNWLPMTHVEMSTKLGLKAVQWVEANPYEVMFMASSPVFSAIALQDAQLPTPGNAAPGRARISTTSSCARLIRHA